MTILPPHDYRELVIRELADSEAETRAQLAEALADAATYREVLSASLTALYRACVELETTGAHYHRLLDECREYRRRLEAARTHYRRLQTDYRRVASRRRNPRSNAGSPA